MRETPKQNPGIDRKKRQKCCDKPQAAGNRRLSEQIRKILGKHYASKFRVRSIAIPGPEECVMTTVKQILDDKGHDVHAIHPGASVFDALKLMAEHNIGSLVVLEDGDLVGIITERHYARQVV
jgi:predicted transcriptional regulator